MRRRTLRRPLAARKPSLKVLPLPPELRTEPDGEVRGASGERVSQPRQLRFLLRLGATPEGDRELLPVGHCLEDTHELVVVQRVAENEDLPRVVDGLLELGPKQRKNV